MTAPLLVVGDNAKYIIRHQKLLNYLCSGWADADEIQRFTEALEPAQVRYGDWEPNTLEHMQWSRYIWRRWFYGI